MNPVALGLDGLLALLLVAALALGAQLNARLKALRDNQAGFAAAVIELNQAAARAEAGLSALKTASESAHDDLLTRIETARSLVVKLERAAHDAERAVPPPRPAPDPTHERLPHESPPPRTAPVGGALAAIAALAEDLGPARADREPVATPRRTVRTDAAPARRPARNAFDEDLFETKPRRREDAPPLGPLRSAHLNPTPLNPVRDDR